MPYKATQMTDANTACCKGGMVNGRGIEKIKLMRAIMLNKLNEN